MDGYDGLPRIHRRRLASLRSRSSQDEHGCLAPLRTGMHHHHVYTPLYKDFCGAKTCTINVSFRVGVKETLARKNKKKALIVTQSTQDQECRAGNSEWP
jgi:hypothetical protein